MHASIGCVGDGQDQWWQMYSEQKIILGRVENVILQDSAIKLKARIDTGAGVSSLHADDLTIISADKMKGVPARVNFRVRDASGRIVRLERDVVDWMRVKRKGDKGYIRRPVVMMDFCLAGKQIEARVNLANRSRFLYPLLVGRNLLKTGDFLIDPAQTFLTNPGCRWKKNRTAQSSQ
jgi:hypothetical protein